MLYQEIIMKKVTTIILVLLISFSANAQFRDILSFNSGGMLSVQWNVSAPMGVTKDFTDPVTMKGISVDYRHCYKRDFIFGGRTGWHKFYEDKGITNIKNGSTSNYVRQENTINAYPILFVVDYMVPSQKFIPYAGLGVGGYFMRTTESNDLIGTTNTNSFHFGVSPEAGITIPFIISNFGLTVSTRYNFVLKSSKTDNFSWFDFNVGLSFMY